MNLANVVVTVEGRQSGVKQGSGARRVGFERLKTSSEHARTLAEVTVRGTESFRLFARPCIGCHKCEFCSKDAARIGIRPGLKDGADAFVEAIPLFPGGGGFTIL